MDYLGLGFMREFRYNFVFILDRSIHMPIYAYRCLSCGHEADVMQKIHEAPLTVCPACGAEDFTKQVTAAGFQLKGNGWYVTDFKGGAKLPNEDKAPAATPCGSSCACS